MTHSRLRTWLQDSLRTIVPLKFGTVRHLYDRSYAERTERFSGTDAWERELRFLVEPIALPEDAHILDVGCNTGQAVGVLKRMLPRLRYTGIDINKAALERASMQHGAAAAFIHYEGSRFPLEADSFDCVIFNHSLGHVADVALSLAEAHRVLKPAGAVLVATPNRAFKRWKIISNLVNGYDPDPTVLRYFSPASLERALAAAGFASVKTWLGGEAATRFAIDPQRTLSRLFAIASKPRG